MPSQNELKHVLRRKKKAGLLPPPLCPKCKSDLRDHDVPAEYVLYAALFGLAREVVIDRHTAAWLCPVCDHVWGKHVRLSPRLVTD